VSDEVQTPPQPPARPWWRRTVWLALAAGISGYLLFIVGRELELRQLWAMARGAPPATLAGALGLYLLLGCWRTLRFKVLLREGRQRPLPLLRLLPVVLLHNLLVRTLPLWTGEIAFVTLTRRHLETPIGDSVGSLLGARLLELLLVLVGGLTSLLLIDEIFQLSRAAVATVGSAGLLLCLAGLFVSGAATRRIAGWLDAWGGGGGRAGRTLLSRGAARLDVAGERLGQLRNRRTCSGALALTVCTYGTSIGFNLLLLRSAGVEGALPALVAAISVVILTSAIPLSISGLGVVDGGWTWGLVMLVGVELGRAASISFYLHGVQLLCALLTGALGYLWLQGLRLAAARAGAPR